MLSLILILLSQVMGREDSMLNSRLVMAHTCDSYGTCLNHTQLMMKFTKGNGCAENESFVEIPQFAICCEDNLFGPSTIRRLTQNVCLSRPSFGSKMAPRPRCACNKG